MADSCLSVSKRLLRVVSSSMILILGVAGSGKSTQGKLLQATGSYTWLSMGELLRRTATQDEQQRMLTGAVLPDDITIHYVSTELQRLRAQHVPEIALDGFPRSVAQAEWLVCYADQYDPLRAIVHLEATQDQVLQRLLARGRIDDTPEAIRERFTEYDKTIVPIMQNLAHHGVPIIGIDAHQIADAMHQDIIHALKELEQRQ